MWRAERLYPDTEIVSRTHEGRTRHTYAEYAGRTAQLANALDDHGIERGDRVATFCWNHTRHFETYFGVPNTGAQLHTINPLLPDEHIRYIVDDADDEIVFVDPSLAEKIAGAAEGAEEFEGVDFVAMGSEGIDALDAPATRSSSRTTRRSTTGPTSTATSPPASVTPPARRGSRRASSTPSRCCGATRWPPRRRRGSRWRTRTW
jgi:fatty-acyl-CoA synthase